MLTAERALEQTAAAIKDAVTRAGEYVQWYAFPQTWPSTTCGHGGIGGRAVTEAQTVIAAGDDDAVHVYFAGRFAYTITKPTKLFWKLCAERDLPAKGRTEGLDKIGAKP